MMAKQKQEKPLVKTQSRRNKTQFVLTIGDEGAILVHMRGDQLQQRLFVSLSSEADLKKMLALLESDSKAPIAILMDIMDQSYSQQSLPAVSSLTIGKLVKRKLDRDYAADNLKGAIPLGRSRSGRRDWNYLFVASPVSGPLASWLDVIINLPNNITGIYLLPIELGSLVERLQKKLYPTERKNYLDKQAGNEKKADVDKLLVSKVSRWQLIITHDKVGGFRQAAFKDGKIVFTRLINSSIETSADILAGNIEQELINTIEYLRRLSFQENDGYDITIITSKEIKQSLTSSVMKANHVSLLTPYEVATKLGLGNVASQDDKYADVVIASHFTQVKPSFRLHTPETGKLYMLNNALRVMRIVFSIALPLLLVGVATKAVEIYNIKTAISAGEKERSSIQAKWQNIEKNAYNIQDAFKISDIVTLYKLLSGGGFSPLTVIADFKAIQGSDALVRDINWEIIEGSTIIDATGNPIKGKNTIKIVLNLDFINKSNGFEGLYENFDLFIKRIQGRFNHYTVENSRLPERITFDDKNKIIPVSVTISGPKDPNDKAQ
jgi:hypothetical protein